MTALKERPVNLQPETIQRFRKAAGSTWHGFVRYVTEIEDDVIFSREAISENSVPLRMYRGEVEVGTF